MNTTLKSMVLLALVWACAKKDPTPSTPTTPIVVDKNFVPAGWKSLAKIIPPGASAATTVAIGNKIYMGLGYSGTTGYSSTSNRWFEYDIQSDKWTEKASFPGTSRANAVGFQINGKAYVGLGSNYDRVANGDVYIDFYEYDPTTDKWTKKADFPAWGRDQPAYFTIGKKGYVGTGNFDPFSPTTVLRDFYEYDAEANKWKRLADFPSDERCRAMGFSIGDTGYIGGGENAALSKLNDMYTYSPETNTWRAIKSLPTPISRARGTSVVGMGYIIGGLIGTTGSDSSTNKVLKYDPATNTWTELTEIATDDATRKSRYYPFATGIGSKLYIGGGSAQPTTAPINKTDFYEFAIP